jgi:hypothetical protein
MSVCARSARWIPAKRYGRADAVVSVSAKAARWLRKRSSRPLSGRLEAGNARTKVGARVAIRGTSRTAKSDAPVRAVV